MPEIKLDKHVYKVEVIESEAGWGSRVDEVKYFDSEQSAKDFVRNYNLKYNNQPTTPIWYMVAQYCGKVR